ncbi:unnamed protein product, partial [Rotaria sp. Silwood2]
MISTKRNDEGHITLNHIKVANLLS